MMKIFKIFGSPHRKSFGPWIRIGLPCSIATLMVTLAVANLGDQQKDIDYRLDSVSEVSTPAFQRTVESMMGPSIVGGNQITAYQNGDQIFPAMLDAIRSAKQTINFESYIYIDGKIGEQFVDALAERAKAGVKVHLLIDWAGSKLSEKNHDKLIAAGVDVKFYHPLNWFAITRMNNRTHRKLLIVDAKVGFTGGVGISDEWSGNADSKDHWRDSHFKVMGPVVSQLQSAFVDNWMATSPDILQGELYFPKVETAGALRAQLFKSAPREGAASAQMLYLLALSGAKSEVLIQNAYFVPGKLAIRALLNARARGVKIRIIVPSPIIDSKMARHASRYTWGELLEKGVEIYEYQPTMYHVKMMIIDQELVSVGSTNFDDRSFRLNSEANLNVFDSNFAVSMQKVFEDDLAKSKRITFEDWKSRSITEKFLDWSASIVSNQL